MSDLDGRVVAIAGVAGGLGPVVAERLAAAGATIAGDRLATGARSTRSGSASGSPPSAGTGARSTCSTRRRRGPGARRCSSASAASTRSPHLVGGWRGGQPLHDGAARRLGPPARPPGPHRAAHHPCLPRRPARERARAASSSSPPSRRRRPTNTNAAYAAAKAAAEAWTLALADGFEGTRATANIIVVDAILTPRMREESPGEEFPTFTPAEHIAEAIAFLCSDAAQKMNGQRFPLTMRG